MANEWEVASEEIVDPMAVLKGLASKQFSLMGEGEESVPSIKVRAETHKFLGQFPHLEKDYIRMMNQSQPEELKEALKSTKDEWEIKSETYVPQKEGLWPGLIKPTLKAIPKVLGATLGSMAALPGAGIEAGARLLPRISTDPSQLIESGNLQEAQDVLDKRLGVFQNFITTPEEAQGAENLGLAMKPIEMAGKGWAGLAEFGTTGDIQKAAQVVKGESPGSNIAAPIAGTIGEFSGMFLPISPKALKQLRTRIVNSDRWRAASIKERGLIIQDLDDVLRNPQNIKAGMTEADIVRQYGGKYFDQAIDRRMTGESSSVFEDILETKKAAKEPPIEAAAAGGVQQEIPEFIGKPAERLLPAKVPPIEPTELKKVPEEPRPIIGPEGGWVEGAGDIQKPYPGQQQLAGPISLLEAPKTPPKPPSKPIRGPVGGSSAFFPEGAPIQVPPALQIAGPPGPIPMAEPTQPKPTVKQPKVDTLESDLLAEFGPKGMNPYVARQAALQIRGGIFTIDDLRAKYGAKQPVPIAKPAVQELPIKPTIVEQPKVEPKAQTGEEKAIPWADLDTGDTWTLNGETLQVVEKGIRVKKDAQALADKENADVWIDGKNTWAVVKRNVQVEQKSTEKGKEPWEMSKTAWRMDALRRLDERGGRFALTGRRYTQEDKPKIFEAADAQHRASVETAISEGKPVSAEVLADFPDLQELGRKVSAQLSEAQRAETAKTGTKIAPAKTITPGRAWIKDQWRPFTESREITKGKNKGKIEIISRDKKFYVTKDQVTKWPGEAEEKKVEEPPKESGVLSKLNKKIGEEGAFSWQKKPKEGEGLLDAIKSLQRLGQLRSLVSISELRDKVVGVEKIPAKDTNEYIRQNTGAKTPEQLLKYYQNKYPELDGVTIGGLESTKESGPLKNAGVARGVLENGKLVPSESQIHLTKDADLTTARHEIEHFLDLIHGRNLEGKPTFSRYDHANFSEDYLSKKQPQSIQGKMTNEAFDAALLQLSRDGKVALHKHDSPFSLSEEARNKLLVEEQPGAYHEGKNYYVGVVPKDSAGGGILSKERGEVGGASFQKKKGVTKEDIERTDTTQADLSTPKQIWETLKKGHLKLSKEDATILERYIRIPLWVGKAHKQYKPIQDVIDDRFRDYHIIRNGYVKELLDSWEGLSKESLDKVGAIHWKEDALGKVLSEKGKAKLTPEELRAYETDRAVLDFIWKDHLPDIYLQTRLGKRKWEDLDEVERDELQKEIQEIIDAGFRPGYMPHPRPGRYFAKASIPAKSEVKTRKGLPYKSESQLKEALRMRGMDPEKYNTIEVEDGFIAQSKVDDSFETIWREHFDDVIATATGKGRKFGIPTISYKKPGIEKRLEKNFPEALIEVGENTRAFAEEGYFEVSPGVTQELIGAALKRMGPEATPEEIKRFGTALSESVNEIFKVRGFMEHSMKRKGIPGFDKENWQEAIVNYVTGFAGFASKTIASRKLWDVWPKSGLAELPNLRGYAEKQIHDTFSNMDRADETIAKARALMFYDFLGGVVKSALIQPTSNYFNAVPRLTVDTNWATTKMTGEMARAAKDVLNTLYSKATGVEVVPGLTRYQTEKGKRLSDGEQMMLREFREDGTISTQLTDELMGKVPRESFLYGVPEKVSSALRFLFGTMELYNRETTGVVAYRIAESKGKTHVQAVDYTRDIINTTQGKYGRTNLPPFARGDVGKWARMAYSFSFFPHNQLALYRDLGTNHGPRGKYGLMKAFIALMFFGGLGGIPFYKDLEREAQRMTGKNLRSEIAKITGDWSKGIFYGVPGMMGVDITGSIGIGLPSQAEDLLGPPAQYAKRTSQFLNDVKIQDWQRAAEDFALVFQAPRNIMSAYRQATRGVEKRSGKDVVDDDFEQVKLTPLEAGGKALGFQPAVLSEVYRKDETRKGLTTWWNDKRDGLVTAAATHINDEKQMERIEKLIEEFNSSRPDYIAPIRADTIRKRVMPIRTKQERIRREQVK